MKTNSVQFFNEKNTKTVCNGCEIMLAAWNIKNPGNIGHIIRLGHNVGAIKVLFTGDLKNYRESKIKKTAGFSFDQQDWKMVASDNFFNEFDKNFELVVLETCEGSSSIFTTTLPKKTIFLAGNEAHGLPDEIIVRAALKVHIPMPGGCKSMNVSHALSVAAFEWYRQHSI